jgi:hypothetical protein
MLSIYPCLQLQLCVVDSRNRVLKEGCFPVSWSQGRFEVVLRNPPAAGSPLSPLDKFANAIAQLEEMEELAVKAGRRRLAYRGSETAIDNIAMVVTDMGIAPAVQILRQVLENDLQVALTF